MAYTSIRELPEFIKKLPEDAQEFYLKAYNKAEETTKDTQRAAADAWQAVKDKFEDIKEDWNEEN